MLATRWVPGVGPHDSHLVLVGEAPGKEENSLGEPFVGPAGRWLDKGLRDVGLVRRFLYITNVFKQQPPKNDPEYFFKIPKQNLLTEEGDAHVQFLRTELEQLDAKLIVALGDTALWALTGKRGISKWRGSLLPSTLVPDLFVYPTFHPSFVMRMNQETRSKQEAKRGENVYPIFVRDLERAIEASANPSACVPRRDFRICRSAREACELLQSIPAGSVVALDIENLQSPVVITRVGFSYDPSWGFTIPLIPGSDHHSLGSGLQFGFSPSEFPYLLAEISRTAARTDLTFLMHNMMHDAAVLGFYWKIRFANLHDTMILHHATHSHLPKGLKFLASAYTWEPYYKEDGKVHNVRVGGEALSIYNIRDCCVTRELFPLLIQEARSHETLGGYERSLSYTPSLLAMSIRGVACDHNRKDSLLRDFSDKANQCSKEISKWMGKDYNISTAFTRDLQNLLYIDLACEPQYKEGKLTTEDDAILRLLRKAKMAGDERKTAVLNQVRLRKKLLKLTSTYLEMELGPDGRYHTTYDPTGTTTWRLSASESTIGGGANLQNIPKHPDPVSGTHFGGEIRKTFIADPGFILVSADLKQAEAMMVAWLAGELIEINAFLSGKDIHWLNAQSIFGIRTEYDSSNPELKVKRNLAKTIKHAGNYGTGPNKMQKVLLKNDYYFEQSECKLFLYNIRNARPMVELWKRGVEQQLQTNRTLITPLGRKRVFYGRMGPDLFRAGYAFVPQSTVGELVCMAIRDIYQKLEVEQGVAQILLNVHDEVVVQCKPEDVMRVAKGIKSCMEREIIVNGRPLLIPCDFKQGLNWGEMKEFEIQT